MIRKSRALKHTTSGDFSHSPGEAALLWFGLYTALHIGNAEVLSALCQQD